eukprot:jgi/Chrzof1/15100/Cz09g27050.t1_TATB[v5.2]
MSFCMQPIMMSFLGVGAPEAILVAVVALVVFGPKGLAEAAKSLGNTLRAFSPTIREVAQVSQELKGTLEKELGLDDIRTAARPVPRPLPQDSDMAESAASSRNGATSISGDDLARQVDPDIDAKRAMAEQLAWGNAGSQTASTAVADDKVPSSTKSLTELSMEDLEAELARRKAATQAAAAATGQDNKA